MRVVSFFAGCGGLDLGFEQAGFDVVWANEFEPHCRAIYLRNHPDTEFVLGDICKIDPNSIPDCDGFIGGPPCQSWSVGGKMKGLDDERGQLFLKYIELINEKKPKFFVTENVKGMLDEKFNDVFEDFINRLDNAGYDVQWALLDAVNFSVPQNRERVIFVGFRKELDVTFKFPNPTCEAPLTLQQAIGDITETPKFLSGGENTEPLSIDEKRPNHDVLTSKFGSFYYRGNLVEVANEAENENREALLAYFDDASSDEVYQKGHWFIKDEFADLDGWATDDDVMFLLQNIGVLICVPKKLALDNNLIAA